MPKKSKAKTIAATLLEAIQQSGESLYRIAKDTEMPYSRIHDFVNGKGNLALENVEKLCEYFGLGLGPRGDTKK
jgi:molybdenum-dependent DNA-binding transcriptional regulator ModE